MSVLTILVSSVLFLSLHIAVHKSVDQPFDVSLKLSRGVMALLMVGAGVYALWRYFPLWRQVFLVEQPGVSATSYVISALVGHLLADLVWLGFGLHYGAKTRRDLVIHHVLGLLVCAVAFTFETGYVLITVALTTEILPVTTGLGGAGEALASLRLKVLAARLGLLAILAWRLPVWIFLFSRVAWIMRTGREIESLTWVYPIGLVVVVLVTLLDLYWSRLYSRMIVKLSRT